MLYNTCDVASIVYASVFDVIGSNWKLADAAILDFHFSPSLNYYIITAGVFAFVGISKIVETRKTKII